MLQGLTELGLGLHKSAFVTTTLNHHQPEARNNRNRAIGIINNASHLSGRQNYRQRSPSDDECPRIAPFFRGECAV